MNHFLEHYSSIKNQQLYGRYITFKDLEPELKKLGERFHVEEIGRSVLNVPIHSVTLGTGPKKILAWSQMHGNESTTTKAVFDLFSLFAHEDEPGVREILQECTMRVIPMLNPDGAARYTRVNVNEVDLNRDAQALKEEESRVLRKAYEDFQPHFCLNLHDQRSIFSAGDSPNSATLSFLAPAMDGERSIPENRKQAMQLIAAINERMQEVIPDQVGRYDDAFNLQCTGDTFQSFEIPTLLFEAGHYQEDYLREKTREFAALAIFTALLSISSGDFQRFAVDDYLKIPENQKKFFDIILRNALIDGKMCDVAIQFEEKIKAGQIYFEPVIRTVEPQLPFFGHQEINCKGDKVENVTQGQIHENAVVNQILLKGERLPIKTPNYL